MDSKIPKKTLEALVTTVDEKRTRNWEFLDTASLTAGGIITSCGLLMYYAVMGDSYLPVQSEIQSVTEIYKEMGMLGALTTICGFVTAGTGIYLHKTQ
jgi:hypothetical protein